MAVNGTMRILGIIGGFIINMLNVMQGAITKRMTAIEEMAGMDVLCSDKTGTLTLNKLTVDKNLVEVGWRILLLQHLL